ncbi:MAG: thioredoxin family protein [Nitrospirota bacterium]
MSETGELVNLKNVTEATWDSLVGQAELPVVVNFFGPACEHSQKLAPVFGALSHRFVNKMRFAKVDVTAEPGLVARFAVKSTPTLLFFASGRPYFMTIGDAPKHQLESELDHILAQQKRCMARSVPL